MGLNLNVYKEFVNSHFPFLRIINGDAVFSEDTTFNVIDFNTGWVIRDYGDAIELYASGEYESSVGVPMSPIILDQIRIVSEVMRLVIDKKWKHIEFISGTSMLQSILWLESKRCGIVLKGYEPSEKELGWYEEIKKYACQNKIPFDECVAKENPPSQRVDNLIDDLEKLILKYKYKADCQS